MSTVKPGDEVRVYERSNRHGHPGREWTGKIAKVGRKLATIDYPGGRSGSDVFRLDGGTINDSYGHRWFRTLEQVALIEREARAMAVLKEHGIHLEHGHGLSLEQIEQLADVARKF